MDTPITAGVMRRRFAQELVQQTLADTPVTVIEGARQVGKSTLATMVVGDRHARFVTLDDSADYRAAKEDPAAFLRQTDGLLVIDEVQRVPELIRAIKSEVDADRRPGRFLITGSANVLRVRGTQESLAGRAETVLLYGLSQGELRGEREDFIDLLIAGDTSSLGNRMGTLSRADYLDLACAGSYPEPLQRTGKRRSAWFTNYVKRIVSKDAQDVSALSHLDRLPALMQLLAANSSGELVKARVAGAASIPETSLQPYLDLLETLYLSHSLPAWGDNLSGRVTGRPKVSLLDTGLIAHLNHVTPASMAPGVLGGLAGPVLESFAVGEIRRQAVWAETPVELSHFRDRNGLEVDLVVEGPGGKVAGLEMKAAGSVTARDFKGLRFLEEKLGERFAMGVVLHTGTRAVPFGDRLLALPYSALWE